MGNKIQAQNRHLQSPRHNVGNSVPAGRPFFVQVIRPALRGAMVGFIAAACFSGPYFAPAIQAGRPEDIGLAINDTLLVILLVPWFGGALFVFFHSFAR